MTEAHRGRELTPPPDQLDWLHLIAAAERRGIPVARTNRQGQIHALRSVFDLTEFQRNQSPAAPVSGGLTEIGASPWRPERPTTAAAASDRVHVNQISDASNLTELDAWAKRRNVDVGPDWKGEASVSIADAARIFAEDAASHQAHIAGLAAKESPGASRRSRTAGQGATDLAGRLRPGEAGRQRRRSQPRRRRRGSATSPGRHRSTAC